MDPETEHIVDLSLKALDTEIKHAPIRRLASRIFRRKSDPSPVNQTHHREEAVQAALESAVERISRQELTMEQAFQIVGRVVTFDDLEKLNSTWQGHWSEGASKVGIEDEERRTWWARLLAGEIQQPGTFSLRTMAVMDTLSTGEAQLFTRLCGYVWNPPNPNLVLPKDERGNWKPDFAEAAILESIGLVKFDPLSGFTVTSRGATEDIGMMFNDRAFIISDPAGKSLKLRCGPLVLTDVGKEMYRLTTPSFPESYLEEILAEWQESYTVKQVSIVA